MPSVLAMSQTHSSSDHFAPSFDSVAKFVIQENPYIRAANNNAPVLSHEFRSSFSMASLGSQLIKPVFNALASGREAAMDKIGKMARAGQALWDKAGMHYGGENLVVGMLRKRRKRAAILQLKQLRSVPV